MTTLSTKILSSMYVLTGIRQVETCPHSCFDMVARKQELYGWAWTKGRADIARSHVASDLQPQPGGYVACAVAGH